VGQPPISLRRCGRALPPIVSGADSHGASIRWPFVAEPGAIGLAHHVLEVTDASELVRFAVDGGAEVYI
jgi:hypothetical protein